MKIRFDSDDDFLLNKQLEFLTVTTVIKSIFEEGGKLYPQSFSDECLYEL